MTWISKDNVFTYKCNKTNYDINPELYNLNTSPIPGQDGGRGGVNDFCVDYDFFVNKDATFIGEIQSYTNVFISYIGTFYIILLIIYFINKKIKGNSSD